MKNETFTESVKSHNIKKLEAMTKRDIESTRVLMVQGKEGNTGFFEWISKERLEAELMHKDIMPHLPKFLP